MKYDYNEIVNYYKNYTDEKNNILNNLKNIISDVNGNNGYMEGNIFYIGGNIINQDITDSFYGKQLNIIWTANNKEIKKICEIGFNAGHSAFLMLLDKQEIPLEFTVFDINIHKYLKPCFEYIKTKFNNVKFEFIEGNSSLTMPKFISENEDLKETYDLIHVDGDHTHEAISNDMMNANILLKINGIMIVDDTCVSVINNNVDLYLSSGNYIELDIISADHRTLKKIK